MKLTEGAQRLWEGYAADVRRSLAGRDDIDADDVVAGVREHVEAELGARGAGRTTAEELSDVLARLGPPGDWVDAGDAAAPSIPDGPGARADDLAARRWPSVAALAFTVVGATLVLGSPWWAPGWGALVLAAVVARVALEGQSGAEAELTISPPGPLRRLTLVVWWTAVLAAAVLLLLGPAAVTWGAAQTRGALEPILYGGRPDGGPRPAGYWRATGLVMAGVTGLWWLVLSAATGLGRTPLRRALGPAAKLIGRRTPVTLAVAGSALVILALTGGLL